MFEDDATLRQKDRKTYGRESRLFLCSNPLVLEEVKKEKEKKKGLPVTCYANSNNGELTRRNELYAVMPDHREKKIQPVDMSPSR